MTTTASKALRWRAALVTSLVAVAASVVFTPAPGHALNKDLPNCPCTYYVPDARASGDIHYAWLPAWSGSSRCGPTMLDLTTTYGMSPSDWDNGYGYWDCNVTKPFGRVMNSVTALASASPAPLYGSGWIYQAATRPMLDWAYVWTAHKLDDTRGRCSATGGDDAIAHEQGGTVDLYVRTLPACQLAFFHGYDAAERAGTLIHEARHIDGPGHVANGKDVSFGGGGAFDYEITWLQQYGTSSVNSTPWLRCSAIDMGNALLGFAYLVPGPFIDVPSECS